VVTAALAVAMALAANAQSGKAKFGATLKGVKATGTATLTVAGTSVDYKITASGLSGEATAAHIHLGGPTANGPVVVPFPAKAINNGPNGSVNISGSFTAADIKPQAKPTGDPAHPAPPVTNLDELLGQMRAGNTYVNIHTAAHPAGEIRGQIGQQ
jgi:hypothetical protein